MRAKNIAVALGLFAACAMTSLPVPAASAIGAAEIDRIVARAMSAFTSPGVAVGVVKGGKLVFAKGYGVRKLGDPAP
jgi:CubicO group peptidase (beta-lactamase class C family)